MATLARNLCLGLGACGCLVLGHVFGMLAADWSRDIFDFYPECIYENWYDFVNGDFSDFLSGISWAGLIMACILYAALLVSTRTKAPFFVVLCLYAIIWIAWVVVLIYILLFYSYIYFEETRLVHTCGGLPEIRNIWWMSVFAIFMVIPASMFLCCFFCIK